MRAIAILVALLATGACGATAETSTQPSPEQGESIVMNAPEMTENELRKELGLDDMGMVKVKDTTCEAAVVMTDESMIEMYVESGDMVVANQSGNLGVKVVGDRGKTCIMYFQNKLSAL